ncbi:MAG: 30S ribosomal protein S3ae [Crenarchaeota archaeon]|nr:30S ribosomal protein S3ae [Thermoproteota archaeon]MDW8033714.1 30S ribosomal protein S3ae [Nitrososphaerota archaeon]
MVKQKGVKKWFPVIAPDYLGGKQICQLVTSNVSDLIGRTISLLLSELTDDPSHTTVKIKFKVIGIRGESALTDFWGYELDRDFIRSLLRKGSSRVDRIFEATTKDGYKMRITVLAITRYEASQSQKKKMRKAMMEIILNKCNKLNYAQFIQELVFGKIESDLYNEAKKFHRIKLAGVKKMKIIEAPIKLEEIKASLAEAA